MRKNLDLKRFDEEKLKLRKYLDNEKSRKKVVANLQLNIIKDVPRLQKKKIKS